MTEGSNRLVEHCVASLRLPSRINVHPSETPDIPINRHSLPKNEIVVSR